MILHENGTYFKEAIDATGKRRGLDPALVEKDYFVTLFLAEAVKRIPGLIFKGGTSLSKCHHLIDRFSEDVDLTLDEEHFTQSPKRKAVTALIDVCDALGFELLNRDKIEHHTHGNYNCYEVAYPISFPSPAIKTELKVEMTYIQKAYPTEEKMVNCYIGEFLSEIGRGDLCRAYGLEAFPVRTQTLERTFVDKVFAICDYFLSENETRNSRHIYDIAKLLTRVDLGSPSLKILIEDVREDRRKQRRCLSAQEGVSVSDLLLRIVESNFYKRDYEKVTAKLLGKRMDYEEALQSLKAVASSGLF